jgi:hypothetical protein
VSAYALLCSVVTEGLAGERQCLANDLNGYEMTLLNTCTTFMIITLIIIGRSVMVIIMITIIRNIFVLLLLLPAVSCGMVCQGVQKANPV